jgi:RAB6A-GEF complex partner protein 2
MQGDLLHMAVHRVYSKDQGGSRRLPKMVLGPRTPQVCVLTVAETKSSQDSSTLPTPSITLQDASPPTRYKRSESLLSSSSSRKGSNIAQQEPGFPAGQEELGVDFQTAETDTVQLPLRKPSPRSDGQLGGQDTLNPISRIITGTSVNGTPRSSTEIYSGSNHSDETLASEYPAQQIVRPVRSSQYRRSLKLPDVEEQAEPEVLMMGYAQVMGSFTLDGSLVNQEPFEEVKRKGVVGGQGGGGVVGVESKQKRESGLLGAFGWSNIGESIGGLLGGGELSSIKEMRTIASSKAIPLISTPQSILFVDVKLAPGESKRYSYKFTLPRGLPPSHRGRAIKVSYQITIGVQRPGSSSEQRIKSVDVPFRVFGTVNGTSIIFFQPIRC